MSVNVRRAVVLGRAMSLLIIMPGEGADTAHYKYYNYYEDDNDYHPWSVITLSGVSSDSYSTRMIKWVKYSISYQL